jgi:DNA-binding MarR family transcriptional regulator
MQRGVHGMQHGDPTEEAIRSLGTLILAGERYRQLLSEYVGLGVTEMQAVSYLVVHGDRGQNELAADLGLTSGAATGLVDRLERQAVAERYPHQTDRRRTLVRLTARGHQVALEGRRWLLAGFEDVSAADLEVVAAQLRSIAHRLSEQSIRAAQRGTFSPLQAGGAEAQQLPLLSGHVRQRTIR